MIDERDDKQGPRHHGRRRRWLALVAVALALAALEGHAMDRSEAVQKVRRETGGKVLASRTIVQGNRKIHIIRVLLPDGRVRDIRVPGDRVDRPS